MAVYHHQSSATIRGITYSYGQAFTCASAQGGSGDSQGNGASITLTAGGTYYYYGYATDDYGNLTAYPYLIRDSANVLGWYKENIFPYAKFKITFNPNGGELKNPGGNLNNGSNTNSVTVTYTLSAYWAMSGDIPTRTGYTFNGWYTSPSGGTQVYDATGHCTNEGTYWKDSKWVYRGNVTLYAQWTPYTYTISYNANGGSGVPSTQTKTHDKDLTLSNTRPTRTGYTFAYWNTRSDGSGTTYYPGGTFKTNGSTTLYAIWSANTYSVTYNANGGTNAPSTQTKTYGVDLTLAKSLPTRVGYTFASWNTKSNGSGTSYAPGSKYVANADVTLYAIWNIIVYMISYDANGGSGAPGAQSKNHGANITLSSQIPTRKHYKFLYWSTKSDGTGTTYYPGASFSGNTNLALYAIWKKQDDVRVNVGNAYKRGRATVKVGGTYKTGRVRVKVNGTWQKGD